MSPLTTYLNELAYDPLLSTNKISKCDAKKCTGLRKLARGKDRKTIFSAFFCSPPQPSEV